MKSAVAIARYEDWVIQARALLSAEISPKNLIWHDPGAKEDLFATAQPFLASDPNSSFPMESQILVPKAFRELAVAVYQHRSVDRAYHLYEILWRLTHGERQVLERLTDPTVHQLHIMRKQVSRDMHKMKAFVRFRHIQRDNQDWYFAWYQPDHRIVRAVSSFFRDRFNNMNWSIFTPDESVHWNQHELTYEEGSTSNPVECDEVEDLWLTYYRSIFNPSRLNVSMMKSEMPVRFWPNLPESAVISELVLESSVRTQSMIEQPGAATKHYIPALPCSIDALKAAVNECKACPLWQNNHHGVLSEGPIISRLALVGEQPGNEEDLTGRPFVGPAGKVLDELLSDCNLSRNGLYMTEAVKHFNHETRYGRRLHKKPRGGHIADCRPWLMTELNLVRPRIIVCLGTTAAQSVLGRQITISQVRNQLYEGPYGSQVIVTYHPSAILRVKSELEKLTIRSQIVSDLERAKTLLKSQ